MHDMCNRMMLCAVWCFWVLQAGSDNYLIFIRISIKRPCEDKIVGHGLFCVYL